MAREGTGKLHSLLRTVKVFLAMCTQTCHLQIYIDIPCTACEDTNGDLLSESATASQVM